MTFPGAFPGSYRGRTNDIKTRRSTATAPLHMQGYVQESRSAISGARCPDALLNGCFCTATPGYSTAVFSRGKSRVVSRASSGQEGQCHFRGPLHTKYTSPVRNKLHTDGNHTHSTQLDTLKHTLRELGRQYALASPQPGFLERVPRYVT